MTSSGPDLARLLVADGQYRAIDAGVDVGMFRGVLEHDHVVAVVLADEGLELRHDVPRRPGLVLDVDTPVLERVDELAELRRRARLVDPAFQYTCARTTSSPTGLVTTSLRDAYPVLKVWQRWGGARAPAAPAPRRVCA